MNTKEEIQVAIQSLRGLNELANVRRGLGYSERKTLNEFTILKGKFYLDSCGNFSKIVGIEGDREKLTEVMTRAETYAVLGTEGCISSASGTPLPKEHQICAVCKHQWSVENSQDFFLSASGEAYHDRCLYLKNSQENFQNFQNLFQLAGFGPVEFTAMENEYWGRGRYYATPWYKVETAYGMIWIGWRKRVINLDWSATGRKLLPFFSDNVTKTDDYIHAWGYAKALEYLKKLRELLRYTPEALERSRKYMEVK